MSTPTVVVHVGMNKTGSTALQQHVFPHFPGVDVLANRVAPRPRPDDIALLPAVRSLVEAGDEHFSPGLLRSLVERAAESSCNRLLLTDEAFTSTLRNRGWAHLERTIGRLARDLPEATILVVYRNPAELIRSSYAQFVRAGGTLSFPQWVDNRAPERFCFDRRQYDVFAVHSLLVDQFGPGVRPLIYEELAADPNTFMFRVAEILGVPTGVVDGIGTRAARPSNVSLSPLFTTALRRCNRAVRRTQFNPHPLFGDRTGVHRLVDRALTPVDRWTRAGQWRVNRSLREAQVTRCGEIAAGFADSNRRLAAAIDVDLARYGYAT